MLILCLKDFFVSLFLISVSFFFFCFFTEKFLTSCFSCCLFFCQQHALGYAFFLSSLTTDFCVAHSCHLKVILQLLQLLKSKHLVFFYSDDGENSVIFQILLQCLCFDEKRQYQGKKYISTAKKIIRFFFFNISFAVKAKSFGIQEIDCRCCCLNRSLHNSPRSPCKHAHLHINTHKVSYIRVYHQPKKQKIIKKIFFSLNMPWLHFFTLAK